MTVTRSQKAKGITEPVVQTSPRKTTTPTSNKRQKVEDAAPLTSDQEAFYQENGYIILKNFFDKGTIEATKQAATELVDQLRDKLVQEGKVPAGFKDDVGFERRLMELCADLPDDIPNLYRAELHLEAMFPLLANAKLLDVVDHLMGQPQALRIFPNYSMRPKVPNLKKHDVVWHQDAGLDSDGGPNMNPPELRQEDFSVKNVVNCWTSLVPATPETGCMQFVPTTHKLGIQPHVHDSKVPGVSEKVEFGKYNTTIDPKVLDGVLSKNKTIHVEMDVGDVVLFNNMLFHRGGYNTSDMIRWSIDWRYQNAARSTHRTLQGHIVRSRDASQPAVRSAQEWSQLALR